jgi:hypothetical protein
MGDDHHWRKVEGSEMVIAQGKQLSDCLGWKLVPKLQTERFAGYYVKQLETQLLIQIESHPLIHQLGLHLHSLVRWRLS